MAGQQQRNGVSGQQVSRENQDQTRPRAGAISGPSSEERPRQVTSESEDLEVKACEHLGQLRDLEANYGSPQRLEDLRVLTEEYVKNTQTIVRNDSNRANATAKPEFKEAEWNGKKTNPN